MADSYTGRRRARFLIGFMLFLVTTVNYADRATLSITGSSIQHSLGISPVAMGYIFSSFAWAYVIAQILGGWLLDRFGTKRVYACSIFFWSMLAALQGFVVMLPVGIAIVTLFVLRFMVGAAEAPAFPGNSRLTATWFPTAERGTASAIFNSSQYFPAVLFTPLMGWITHEYGWPNVYFAMGALGVIIAGSGSRRFTRRASIRSPTTPKCAISPTTVRWSISRTSNSRRNVVPLKHTQRTSTHKAAPSSRNCSRAG